jgi:hypothetical protein
VRKVHRLKVFENMVLRKIFGPKRNELTGEWRKLHKEELCNMYTSPDVIRLIKSRRIRWAWHVERKGTGEVQTGFGLVELREGDCLKDLGINGGG